MRILDKTILWYVAIVSALALWRAPDNPACWWLLGAHAMVVVLILLVQRPGLGVVGPLRLGLAAVSGQQYGEDR